MNPDTLLHLDQADTLGQNDYYNLDQLLYARRNTQYTQVVLYLDYYAVTISGDRAAPILWTQIKRLNTILPTVKVAGLIVNLAPLKRASDDGTTLTLNLHGATLALTGAERTALLDALNARATNWSSSTPPRSDEPLHSKNFPT